MNFIGEIFVGDIPRESSGQIGIMEQLKFFPKRWGEGGDWYRGFGIEFSGFKCLILNKK